MASLPIGLAIARSTTADAVDAAAAAEEEGGYAVWSTVGGTAPDAMAIFAAVALRTTSIRLGTSIVPAYPRHPIVLASQALVLDDLAPGRFHLGVGPSHKPTIEGVFGISMGNPLRYMCEYVTILRQLLWKGKTDFDGEYFNVRASLPEGRTPPRTPILLSALRPNAFRQAGEIADGGISWVCPRQYLANVALPSIRAGAQAAHREPPPLIAHVPVAYTDDSALAQDTAHSFLARYARLPFYARMFEAAGHNVSNGVSDTLMADLVVSGTGPAVVNRLRDVLSLGAAEVLVSLLPTGDAATVQRDFLAAVRNAQ